MDIIDRPAHNSNYDAGRFGTEVDLVVIHVSQGTIRSMNNWFANPAANVSAHFGVSKVGNVYRYVAAENTAWHAGVWNVNKRSIGIEHEGIGLHYVPTEEQLAASAALTAQLLKDLGLKASADTIQPHRAFKATACPADFPMQRYINMVQALMDDGKGNVETVVLHLGLDEPVVLRGNFAYHLREKKIDIRKLD